MQDPHESAATHQLWSVKKEDQHLRCMAVHLTSGVDLRLFEGADFVRRTRRCQNASEAYGLANEWLSVLVDQGWRLQPQ